MKNRLQLIKNYSKDKHINLISYEVEDKLCMNNLKVIYSNEWELDIKSIPYIEITHLLDSYYCIPERPDMAFTYLWKAINTSYNKFYYKKLFESENVIKRGDSSNLDLVIEEIEKNLDDSFCYNDQIYTIRKLIDDYVKAMPIKTLRFVSNYIIKGIVLENKLSSIMDSDRKHKYISSQYSSFKTNFSGILDKIKCTYGEAALDIYEVYMDTNTYEYKIKTENKDKSRKISNSLAVTLKKLLDDKNVYISNRYDSEEIKLELNNDKEYLNFIFKSILYAIRNSTMHGNEASRMNSVTVQKDSVKSSKYIYILGYLFLSLILFVNDDITKNDLYINILNKPIY